MNSLSNNLFIKPPFTGEAVFASLLEAGFGADDIKIDNQGSFKRSYSRDVDRLDISGAGHKFKAVISLNRDGIYDLLPEGLFHQTKGNTRVNSVQDAVEEHKQFKEEEKQARKFFAPLEQMLFLYKAAAETTERDALYDIQNGRLNNSFYQFWNISTTLPEGPSARLLQLMPYAESIKGEIQNTATALSYILAKDVTIHVTEQLMSETITTGKLSDMRLGVDTVSGNICSEWQPVWQCTISNIPDSELIQYAAAMPMGKMLHRFTEIFVPLDVDILFDFVPLDEPLKEMYGNILGIGAYL